MKNKKIKKALKAILIILDISLIIFLYIRGNKAQNTSNTTTTTKTEQVSKRTITKELTESGEITPETTEKLTLTTTKYFKMLCVEEGDYVKEGENLLEYTNGTYLTAPYNLVVKSASLPNTSSICTSSNYIEVESLDNLNIDLTVNESEIDSVKVGQIVNIKLNSNEDLKYTGEIKKINQIGSYESSGSNFDVIVKLTNDGSIKLGMSTSCTLVLDKKENVIAVPIQAIQNKDDKKYVVVINDNNVTKNVEVTTGISDDSYVEITSGISEGEKFQMTSTTTQNTNNSSTKRLLTSGSGNSQSGRPSSEKSFQEPEGSNEKMPTQSK